MSWRVTLRACGLLVLAGCARSGLLVEGDFGGGDGSSAPNASTSTSSDPSLPAMMSSGSASGITGFDDPGVLGVPPGLCSQPSPPPPIRDVDVLFIVDNSGSMREEQVSLRRELPKLVRALTTGDRDGDGVSDGPAVRSLHLGVVSSDMGLVGISDIEKCEGLGDDGILQNVPHPEVGDCQPSYPPFITYVAGTSDVEATANDFACIAMLGTDGCGFEQQLESGLKALWPSIDIDPTTSRPFTRNRITFLGDANGFGRQSHGDTENAGFLRNETGQGPSLLVIVLVTDEEDCSSADTSHFTPAHFLDPSSELAMQDLNLRCFYNPQNLYALERYYTGFRALRPGNEQLVMFAAITGVPPDLVTADALDDAGLYDRIQRDPRMQQAIDPSRTEEQGGNLLPSCDTPTGKAYPPRRIVELARRFGSNGIVQSICQEDFGPALDVILGRVGARIENPCAE
jgi:hypothetical protein